MGFLRRSQGGGLGSNPISSTIVSRTPSLLRGNNCFVSEREDSVCLVASVKAWSTLVKTLPFSCLESHTVTANSLPPSSTISGDTPQSV